MISLNTDHAFSDKAGKHGLNPRDIEKLKPKILSALAAIRERQRASELPFLDLPNDRAAADSCRVMAERFSKMQNFLLAGIGGSALGPAALFGTLAHPLHNLLNADQRKGRPRFFMLDNVDPDYASALLAMCDPRETVFNIISKSGATAETAAASLLVFDRTQKALGPKWKEHVVCTTDPRTGDLRKLCEREGLLTLDLPSGVGGRFSILTPVGLFPAYLLGFDVDALLKGASEMAARGLSDDLSQNPAAKLAAMLYLFDREYKKLIHVMMAYANSLYLLADWFRQLWAESLGKATDLNGDKVNVGPTPVKALGATDQHSQVQLFIEGPYDKVFIFLEAKQFRTELVLPSIYKDVSSLDYLGGQTMNRLMAAEFAATREALARQERPSVTITFPQLDAHSVGSFLMLMEIVTTIAGSLYNINPFDQPGVEHGKVLTYGLMGRKGYEKKI
ncbi:glucose-6-phosphate isomerase [candidate division KSB1 bacterium]|nr:MAG: glucose-6-phosphate isomerase [candidate division KSB1 bacterium]